MNHESPAGGWLNRLIAYCLNNKLLVTLGVVSLIFWGVSVAPFAWKTSWLPRSPIPVDAIPDIGENQQIVFTQWAGRSPQDVQDQITYPLTVSLMGVPGVKTVRSYSVFGFSSIYILFKEDIDFHWSRSRILEKLASLSPGTLPQDVQPKLGPDATALGQVFWYTLEGRDETGRPTGGWDLDELRSVQDYYVRYGLLSTDGVSEVASVGGFVREYQIDVDPDAMRAFGVSLQEVFSAVAQANVDVGARSVEVNQVEYFIRGIGFIQSLEDIERSVITVHDNVPVYVSHVAKVSFGPALRRGALDKEGAEAVGGVVVVRHGENPLQTIENLKAKIREISPGLPSRILEDGRKSQLQIIPFYDRTGLIHETLDTLNHALLGEILITILVVIVMVRHLRSSVLISGLLPLAVLICFGAMKWLDIGANVVALSGIAIAIGTMVDMGIVVCENILKHRQESSPNTPLTQIILKATSEVSHAVLTALSTTVISFLPVFTMEAAEGKLFKPLAWTKTLALVSALLISLFVIPVAARLLMVRPRGKVAEKSPFRKRLSTLGHWLIVGLVCLLLAKSWSPMGSAAGMIWNLLFITCLVGGVLGVALLMVRHYSRILALCLRYRKCFLSLPLGLIVLGLLSWLGFERCLGWIPSSIRLSPPGVTLAHAFPGLGREFMPALDEGSFLYMPTTMPHASIGESMDAMRKQDMAISSIPEVETVVGKLGRAETALDPAPVSMVETIIQYHSMFLLDEQGKRQRYAWDGSQIDLFRNPAGDPVFAPDGKAYRVQGQFKRDAQGALIPDSGGIPFRLWRPALSPDLNPERMPWKGVQSPEDIWEEIVAEAEVPGSTSAPKLQPIAARLVMLQTGMRAPMGIKIMGPDLETIEAVGVEMEKWLKQIPQVQSSAVVADRIIGKPYMEIEIDREAIARYGIRLAKVQEIIELGIGGKRVTTTVEGRERYPVRVRYMRELRDQLEMLGRILVPAPDGTQIPLSQLASLAYRRGPQNIKSEDTFLVGYVMFDRKPAFAEGETVEAAASFLKDQIKAGNLILPPGVSYRFAGNYEHQIRSEKKLMVVVPLCLMIIFLILFLQFRSTPTTLMVFMGILVAWAGGFIMLWLYQQPWFLDIEIAGQNLRSLFQVGPTHLSVAVWVGFLALFGIATDDGVIMASYLDQSFKRCQPKNQNEILLATLEAGQRRVRPCLMTSATTILALMPILTSTGRGSDIMLPMAIPAFGGMTVAIITMFVVPVLYATVKEWHLTRHQSA